MAPKRDLAAAKMRRQGVDPDLIGVIENLLADQVYFLSFFFASLVSLWWRSPYRNVCTYLHFSVISGLLRDNNFLSFFPL